MKGKKFFILVATLLIAVAIWAAVLPAQAGLLEGQTAVATSSDNYPSVIFNDGLRGQLDVSTFSAVELKTAVPHGVSTGPLMVFKGSEASNPVTMTVGAPTVPDLTGIADTWQVMATGPIITSTVWSEHTLLTGTVTIAPGVVVTITPGVTIWGGPDAELVVQGGLIAEGTAVAPIYFSSSQPHPAPGDWLGIRVTKESHLFSLKYALVQYAQNGVYFRASTEGHAYLSGMISHSLLQYNERGVYTLARPDTPPYNHTATSEITITHSLVYSNTTAGMTINTSAGGGWAKDYSLVAHNRFVGNQIGLEMIANTWWVGHSDHRPTIHNNLFSDNGQYGIDVRGFGSSDTSGSDTRMYPVITHNLFQGGPTGLRLYLNPRGSDGTQVVAATVRYNTFRHASIGILMADEQSYNTLTAVIEQNIFYGFADEGAYAIFNSTSRPLTADHNYWGQHADAWAVGAADMVSGTVTVDSFLTAADPPLLTHIQPGSGQPGDWLTLHGANLGELAQLFLPFVIK